MLIEEIKKELLLLDSNSTILEIHGVGSQLFRENPNDYDLIVICDNFSLKRKKKILKIDNKTYDIAFYDLQSFINQLTFLETDDLHFAHRLFNYAYSLRIILEGNINYNWNIFDYREQYLSLIKTVYYEGIGKRVNRSRFTKSWVHYYIILKFYENNNTTITPEMLQDIRTLYDAVDGSQIPIIDWIEEKLNQI